MHSDVLIAVITCSKFFLGSIVITPNAQASITNEDVLSMLARHAQGDWGDVDQHDKAANDAALSNGTRLLSAYTSKSGARVWVITEANRSATTILLPEDY